LTYCLKVTKQNAIFPEVEREEFVDILSSDNSFIEWHVPDSQRYFAKKLIIFNSVFFLKRFDY